MLVRTGRLGVAPALAAGTFLAGQVEIWGGHHFGGIGVAGSTTSRPVLALLAALATVPLAWARSRPLGVAGVVAGVVVAQVLVVTPSLSLVAGLLPVLIATFATAAYAVPTRGLVGLVLALGVQLTITGRIVEERAVGEVVFGSFVLVGAWVLGWGVGERLRRSERAMADAARQLAVQRRASAEIAAQERTRIAHELHDTIAHGVSLMGVQAAAARVMLTRDPSRAEVALLAVEQQARESIGELQRLLGVLRTVDEADAVEPRPGLDRLPRLLESVRRTGVVVHLAVSGTPRPLPTGVDLTAFRVLQEALTNAIKHADRAAVRVRLTWTADALDIDVSDEGLVMSAPSDGHGLVGMRERVALYGGTVVAGPDPGGGFRVRAVLPTSAETR